MFIETKALDEKMDNPEFKRVMKDLGQTVEYAHTVGQSLAILTNGIYYHIIHVGLGVPLVKKIVDSYHLLIDFQYETRIKKLMSYISKESLISGDVSIKLEKIH